MEVVAASAAVPAQGEAMYGKKIRSLSGDWIDLAVLSSNLIETITDLNNRKIGFKSITENIDTTTGGGKLVFHIFGALAEFERDIIRDRTNAGLQAARARGRKGGRPKSLTGKKVAMAQELYNNQNNSISEICKTLNISRATLYRSIKTPAGRF